MIKKLFSAIFLLIVSVTASAAQSNPEQAIINARAQSSDVKNRSMELERMKREAAEKPVGENYTPGFPQIKNDFEQIQKLNSDVFQLTAAKTPINYTAVLKYVAEINHRAVRLRSNLFSADFNEKKEAKNKHSNVGKSQDVTMLLDDLDKSINSFVHSSIFQNLNIVNSEDSLKAQKDLETAIKISSAIKEKMKELTKNDSQK